MRTYLILKERAERWNADVEIQTLVRAGSASPAPRRYSPKDRDALLGESIDRVALASAGLAYERLDQLTMEVLLGVR
jgi:xylose isomerase